MGEEESGGSEGEVNELKVKVTINVNVVPQPPLPSFLPPLPSPSPPPYLSSLLPTTAMRWG